MPLKGFIELDKKPGDYWTNNEIISGVLILSSDGHESFDIQLAQGSVFCEEWVHTVLLEFREHYRQGTRLFSPRNQNVRVESNQSVRLPFEIELPNNNAKKYPPSFEHMYNNVTWYVKFSVGYVIVGSVEEQTEQYEQKFRFCSRRNNESSEDSSFNEYTWTPTAKDFVPISMNRSKSEISLSFQSRVPKFTTLHSDENCRGWLAMGIQFVVNVRSSQPVIVHDMNVELVEFMHTYGKDSLALLKPLFHSTNDSVLEPGPNELSKYFNVLEAEGLTQDFKTEWQQLTHSLRVSFTVSETPDKQFKLCWELALQLLSEAEEEEVPPSKALVAVS